LTPGFFISAERRFRVSCADNSTDHQC
jgi:hypothetical protein